MLAFHGPSASMLRLPNEELEQNEDVTGERPAETNGPKIIPQLLLGGTTTPAQDLSNFLRNSPNLLIATPGRLLDILSSKHVHCTQSSFEMLVMDEADRLLDLGFKDVIQKILRRLPKQRRTGLFSASISEAVDQLIRVGLRNPVRIAVKVKSASGAHDKRTPASLQMTYLVADPDLKFPILSALLRSLQPTPSKSIVYMSTCAGVDYFQHLLPSILPGFVLVPLHGKHPSSVRQKNFKRFVDSISPTVLLTTDVAARGLDIPAVDVVLQVDPPSDPKVFIHRCGRAGRAGRKGLAVTILNSGSEEEYVSFLEIRKTPISQLAEPKIDLNPSDAARTTETFRALVQKDRALHDKGQRAFVSWVQAYRKHSASSIFRVADLDWEKIGRAWGLLRLPKMPELKGWEGDRSLGVEVNYDTYAYRDTAREKHRKEEVARRKADSDHPALDRDRERALTDARDKQVSWSQKKTRRKVKEERRQRKAVVREKARLEKMTPAEREREQELQRMISRVRENMVDDGSEFAGFDD